MEKMPFVKIQIDGMRYEIGAFINDHNKEINSYVQKRLKEIFEGGEWMSVVDNHINSAIRNIVASHFFTGKPLYTIIEKAVQTHIENLFAKGTAENDSHEDVSAVSEIPDKA